MKKLSNLLFQKYYLLVFLIPLIVNPFGFSIFNDIKISWFLFFIGIFYLGFITTFFENKKITFLQNKNLFLFIFLFIFSATISTILAISPMESFFGEYSAKQGLVFYLFLFIHFFICLSFFNDKKNINLFFNLLKFLALIISIHSLFQYFDMDFLLNGNKEKFLGRVSSTIGQPNFLGQFLIFPFFVLFFSIKELFKNKENKSHLKKKLFIEIFIFLLVLITIFLTKNRATWLAIFSTFFIIFLYSDWISKKLKFFLTLFSGFSLFLALNFLEINMRSVNSRFLLRENSLKTMNSSNIFFGNGLNSFKEKFIEFMPKKAFEYEEFYTIPANAHNVFLQTFIEKGLFGLLIYLIIFYFLFSLFFKKKIKNNIEKTTFFGIISIFISVQFSFFTIEHFIFLTAFFAILLLKTIKLKEINLIIKNKFSYFFIIIILYIFTIFTFYSSFVITKTDIFLKKGINEYLQKGSKSFETFEIAVKSSKYFSYPKEITVGLFSEKSFENEKDKKIYGKKIEKYIYDIGIITNNNFNFYLLKMQFYAEKNNLEKVEFYAKKAEKISSNLPIFYTKLGNIYFEKGECKKAIFNYKKLINLAPQRFILNIKNCKNIDSCRIFIKNASLFNQSLEKMDKCLNI